MTIFYPTHQLDLDIEAFVSPLVSSSIFLFPFSEAQPLCTNPSLGWPRLQKPMASFVLYLQTNCNHCFSLIPSSFTASNCAIWKYFQFYKLKSSSNLSHSVHLHSYHYMSSEVIILLYLPSSRCKPLQTILQIRGCQSVCLKWSCWYLLAMFVTAWFTIGKRWRQPKCPQTEDW